MKSIDANIVDTLKCNMKHVDSDKWLAFISEFIVLRLPNLIRNESYLSFS